MNHSPQEIELGTTKLYVLGFVLSLLLTLAAYFVAMRHVMTGWAVDLLTASLAVVQAIVQLLLFFQLGRESKPRWNLVAFLFMVMVIVIIVFGSIWIMDNLNYNLMVM